MGYFANGAEGEEYRAEYCDNCKNNGELIATGAVEPMTGAIELHPRKDCAVWAAHLMHNYAECNNKDSILHYLIPRNDKGGNEQCRMFRDDEYECKGWQKY